MMFLVVCILKEKSLCHSMCSTPFYLNSIRDKHTDALIRILINMNKISFGFFKYIFHAVCRCIFGQIFQKLFTKEQKKKTTQDARQCMEYEIFESLHILKLYVHTAPRRQLEVSLCFWGEFKKRKKKKQFITTLNSSCM